jgi:geranylgeranyl diphosphate synthase, type II
LTLAKYMADRRAAVDAELERLIPMAETRPASIHQAMRHSLFAGGKRLRPILMWAAAEAVAGEAPRAVTPACALELIHTYSLIHDDLPALDNDDFRRGVPTCHKVFGEALAILAGDALLTRAFQVLAEAEEISPRRRIALVAELAAAAGTVDGMIGGQVEDLEAEGQPLDADRLHYIHRSKTGALLRVSVVMGGIYACADEAASEALSEYGRRIGLAFQIVDDILDVTGDSATLGKTAGKDEAQGKATFPALYGLDESRRQACEHYKGALSALEPLGDSALRLRQIAERVVTRSA